MSPSTFVNEENEINVNETIDIVKQHINKQPTPVKKSLLAKIKAVINPLKSDTKAPVVQTKPRGRPSLKTQLKNREKEAVHAGTPPRHSSHVSTPSRHSSYGNTPTNSYRDPYTTYAYSPQEDSYQDPHKNSSQTPTSKFKRSQTARAKGRQSNAGAIEGASNPLPPNLAPEDVNSFLSYRSAIPPIFYQYLTRVQDVQGDGNCGFRAIAIGLGMKEKMWPQIRAELSDECTRNAATYSAIDEIQFEEVRNTIDWGGIHTAPESKWLQMPFTGLMIANRWNVVLHFFSKTGCCTFFPLYADANAHLPHRVISIVHAYNHYISVKVEGDYPMPAPSPYWSAGRNNRAKSWAQFYDNRIERYKNIVGQYITRDFVNLL
jgi:hypothetical protein